MLQMKYYVGQKDKPHLWKCQPNNWLPRKVRRFHSCVIFKFGPICTNIPITQRHKDKYANSNLHILNAPKDEIHEMVVGWFSLTLGSVLSAGSDFSRKISKIYENLNSTLIIYSCLITGLATWIFNGGYTSLYFEVNLKELCQLKISLISVWQARASLVAT